MKKKSYYVRRRVWKVLTPLFPFLRITFGFLRPLRYKGRESYHIGYIKEGLKIEEVEAELEKLGFKKYCVAWIDQGEVLGMRKTDGFEWQYHLRVFNDGEVRGHYELTPEYRTWKHFFDIGKVGKVAEFQKTLSGILK